RLSRRRTGGATRWRNMERRRRLRRVWFTNLVQRGLLPRDVAAGGDAARGEGDSTHNNLFHTKRLLMLPQTNLQLYRLMMEGGADEKSLAQVRAAYDLARRFFAGYHRPSHKPFLCHLVGTAGALTQWRQASHVVVAGLLH